MTIRVEHVGRRVEETPYDSELGYASAVHQAPDGTRLEVVKGAPETVLDLLAPGPGRDAARTEAGRLAATGRRVLAVVEDRRWAGLLAVSDPPHPDAAEVVARCREAGIRTVLVTGDHPATVPPPGAPPVMVPAATAGARAA